MFKLYAWNVAFWAIAPTIYFRRAYDSQVNERVDGMWKIHENRVAKGLGGTVEKSGYYD